MTNSLIKQKIVENFRDSHPNFQYDLINILLENENYIGFVVKNLYHNFREIYIWHYEIGLIPYWRGYSLEVPRITNKQALKDINDYLP